MGINIYLIARIAKEYHKKQEALYNQLERNKQYEFNFFMPHLHNPFNVPFSQLESEVAKTDYDTIENAHVGLILPPFGEDCSCEIGYFFSRGIPTVLFAEENPANYHEKRDNWINNWMVKYAITGVAAENNEIYNIIKNDAILRCKEPKLVANPRELAQFLLYMALIHCRHNKSSQRH
jgi:nucleoside 2-deoxyribosyltransferase